MLSLLSLSGLLDGLWPYFNCAGGYLFSLFEPGCVFIFHIFSAVTSFYQRCPFPPLLRSQLLCGWPSAVEVAVLRVKGLGKGSVVSSCSGVVRGAGTWHSPRPAQSVVLKSGTENLLIPFCTKWLWNWPLKGRWDDIAVILRVIEWWCFFFFFSRLSVW